MMKFSLVQYIGVVFVQHFSKKEDGLQENVIWQNMLCKTEEKSNFKCKILQEKCGDGRRTIFSFLFSSVAFVNQNIMQSEFKCFRSKAQDIA